MGFTTYADMKCMIKIVLRMEKGKWKHTVVGFLYMKQYNIFSSQMVLLIEYIYCNLREPGKNK